MSKTGQRRRIYPEKSIVLYKSKRKAYSKLMAVCIPQKNSLWSFIDDKGTFRFPQADSVSRLYFPLANEAGILSSITPDLHGDIKTNHNSFLTWPVTIEDLHDSKVSRNFWVYIEGVGPWSLTGVSSEQMMNRSLKKDSEKLTVEAGMLWHKMIRENDSLGLKAEIINFAPTASDTLEIMMVSLTNTGKTKIKITPTAAIPIFARSADNLRDHYHVTSLLHRIISHPAGVIVKPTMSFDERGHKINETLYSVLGVGENGELPVDLFSTLSDFIGEGGHLESPKAIVDNLPALQKDGPSYHGKSALGGIRFKTVVLAPKQSARFVLFLCISNKENEINELLKKYGTYAKADAALKENRLFWSNKVENILFRTPDKNFDGWIRWVALQPTLRKIFGCSFLPDFDYGRGGRGWRDLWQDCLALLLGSSTEAKNLLINNFNGVRIDGSNATIIGSDSNEFIADRNSIARVWMDHGVWPYLTLELYIHQSGDFDILLENAGYFKDRQLYRARKKDPNWNEESGNVLRDKKGTVITGTILEHILVQHLVQFYNVGEHNHIRLENADWNDGLDMAYERGESVAFTTLYGSNLKRIATLLELFSKRTGIKKLALQKELLMLLDRVNAKPVDYDSAQKKKHRLEKYFEAVSFNISGTKKDIAVIKIVRDLQEKADFIFEHVRKKEWIATRTNEGLFNGYYDNHGKHVEGDFPTGTHMTLAGQVFPIMSGIATHAQVEEIFKTAKKYLKDKEHGGFRLNTNFHQIRPDLGRAFSFAYGEKENGAFFSHMAVMFANALYQRGFVNEGREVLDSIYRMCMKTDRSKIYPGIPEYFNSEGRGMYHYLTGSASWLILTVLTQVFGVRGHYGDLLLSPKLTKDEFGQKNEVSLECTFAGKRLKVIYKNPKKIAYEHYCITDISINQKKLKELALNTKEVLIPKDLFLKSARKSLNILEVRLE